MEDDIWGRPFQVIRNRYKSRTPPPSILASEAKIILEELFPRENQEIDYENFDPVNNSIIATRSELSDIAMELNTRKAVGLDKVPPCIIKSIIQNDLTTFTKFIQNCIDKN